jgi:hypothetical protein
MVQIQARYFLMFRSGDHRDKKSASRKKERRKKTRFELHNASASHRIKKLALDYINAVLRTALITSCFRVDLFISS